MRDLYITLLMAVALLLGTPADLNAAPATVGLQCNGNADDAHLNLVVEKPLSAEYRVDSERSEVVFTFNRSFILKSAKIDRCSPLIRAVQSGFNTLVISGMKDTTINTIRFPTGYGVEFSLIGSKEEPRNPEDVQLATERARLLYQQGKVNAAVNELERTVSSAPHDPDLLYQLASYRDAAGDARGAARAIGKWARLRPDKARQNSEYRRLTAPFRPKGGVVYEHIKAGSTFQQERYGVASQVALSDEMPADRIQIRAEKNEAKFTDLRSPQGRLEDVSPDTGRIRATLLHPYDHDQLEVGMSGADYTLGGHARYELRDHTGATSFKVLVSEPDWDYASTIAYEGKKSAFGVLREQRFSSRLTGSAEVANQLYSLSGVSDAAKVASVNASLSYGLIEGEIPVQLNYVLDADYFYDMATRPDENGIENDIFSTETTEFHIFTIGASRDFKFQNPIYKPLSFYGYGGYSFDRLGGDAPQVGTGLRGGFWDGPEFSIEAGRSFSTVSGTSNTQNRVLASINWNL